MISGVIRKVRTPIPRFRTLMMVLMAGSIGSFFAGAGGPTKSASPGVHDFAIALSIPQFVISIPSVLIESSPLVTKAPAQKTDRRASRENLERTRESDISFEEFTD